jgi:predicted GTPase
MNNKEQHLRRYHMESRFHAAKSRSKRPGWSILFYHPLRRDLKGKALRVRRGLDTDDDSRADSLVSDMNRLLSDSSYWTPAARDRALRDVDPKIVSIFYDDIESKPSDPWSDREAIIRLPDRSEGYSRVLLLGTTGAGKTTLVRQLIGSDPRTDRFPSTSTAKTTVFDIELILTSPPYRSVVSFLSRDKVRHYLAECLVAAVSEAAEGGKDEDIARRLLEHSDQRFRLSYLLGTLSTRGAEEDEEGDEEDTENYKVEAPEVDAEEHAALETRLRFYLDRVKSISDTMRKKLAGTLDLEVKNLTPGDKDAFLELLEDSLLDDEEAQSLIDDIEEDIEARFQLLENGRLEADRSGWPIRWQFETEDRAAFIRTVNRFSSNYARNFGKLLTPLVQGLRVAGPFQPIWRENRDIPKLVLIDTEGLGHTPNSASSIPTSVTRRFDSVDVILLVDSATQPMVAGAQAVLRNVAASGHESKLIVVFTHLDQVRGDNLPNEAAKRNHVRASLENAVRGVEEALGSSVGRCMLRQTEQKTFFVGDIDEFEIQRKRNKEQLTNLLETLQNAITPPAPVQSMPVYDLANLVVAAEAATMQFQELWDLRLPSEHWTRVKALTRRLGYLGEDSYDTLMPVADLIRLLQKVVRTYIGKPRDWKPKKPSDEMCDAAIDLVAQEFFTRLHKMVPDTLWLAYLKDWQRAYDLRGPGTGNGRKQDVKTIYSLAAPVPRPVPTPEASEFLDTIRSVFREAANAAGAVVI